MSELTVSDLKSGLKGYVAPWTIYRNSQGKYFVHRTATVDKTGGGTMVIAIKKVMDVLQIDLSTIGHFELGNGSLPSDVVDKTIQHFKMLPVAVIKRGQI